MFGTPSHDVKTVTPCCSGNQAVTCGNNLAGFLRRGCEFSHRYKVLAVTQFGSGENEQLPAPRTGGLYKTNRQQRGRFCSGLSVLLFRGGDGTSFQTESLPGALTLTVFEGWVVLH